MKFAVDIDAPGDEKWEAPPSVVQANHRAVLPNSEKHVLPVETLVILGAVRLGRRCRNRLDAVHRLQRIADRLRLDGFGGVQRLESDWARIVAKGCYHGPAEVLAVFLLHTSHERLRRIE